MINFFSVSHRFILLQSYSQDYSLSNLYFDKSIPKCKFLAATNSSSSVSDFLPKLRNFIKSLLLKETKSPKVSTSAALRQFKARTERSKSVSFDFRSCLM